MTQGLCNLPQASAGEWLTLMALMLKFLAATCGTDSFYHIVSNRRTKTPSLRRPGWQTGLLTLTLALSSPGGDTTLEWILSLYKERLMKYVGPGRHNWKSHYRIARSCRKPDSNMWADKWAVIKTFSGLKPWPAFTKPHPSLVKAPSSCVGWELDVSGGDAERMRSLRDGSLSDESFPSASPPLGLPPRPLTLLLDNRGVLTELLLNCAKLPRNQPLHVATNGPGYTYMYEVHIYQA